LGFGMGPPAAQGRASGIPSVVSCVVQSVLRKQGRAAPVCISVAKEGVGLKLLAGLSGESAVVEALGLGVCHCCCWRPRQAYCPHSVFLVSTRLNLAVARFLRRQLLISHTQQQRGRAGQSAPCRHQSRDTTGSAACCESCAPSTPVLVSWTTRKRASRLRWFL
jgi:hypothetical protein